MKKRTKKRRKPRQLKPGEAEYAGYSILPGVSKVEAARRAKLDYVPSGAHVERFRQEVVQRGMAVADLTAERVILELMRVGLSDAGRMFDAQGNMIPIDQMDEDTRRAIAGFDVEKRTERHGDSVETYYVMKPRLWNKNQALETLAKFHYDLKGKLLPPTGNGGALTPAVPVVHVHFVPPQKLADGSPTP